MSSLAFLVTELQSLASETKRKHPEIREAAEKSLAILRSSPEQATSALSVDGPHSDDLLRPVFMGCATKNAKVVAISLGSLQRLIALKAVPQTDAVVERIVNTMSDAMSQGVDIQLRILQTLVSLITNFVGIHGALLGDALLLCFKLQESKIVVVSSTAAATLRQLVMYIVDKMVLEDKRMESADSDSRAPSQPSPELTPVELPDGTTKLLGPSSRDTFSVFEDLCLLANSEKSRFLKLESLHKTFALELVESVLTNYYELFRKRPEMILLLRHHLCPLLLKALSERSVFPLTLRCMRVVFLLLKQFSFELKTEAEVFLMLLIRLIAEDADGGDHVASHPIRPHWMRVIAMEIMRGLSVDAELMRKVWDRYDAQENGSKVFSTLVTALKRLVTEKPSVLGVSSQMGGVGVSADGAGSAGAGYGLDVSSVAGRVATAASATVSGVVGMMGSSAGLSVQGSAMKLQCIDQLDKADSPVIPDSYIYLLAVQCIDSLCEGFATFTGPLYTSIVVQRPRTPGDAVVRAPPALDLSTLPQEDNTTKQLYIVRNIIESCWPALLAALSFIIGTNLSDELFVDVLGSHQAITNVAGMLGLATPRDAFFTSLAKLAVPSRVVSSLDSYIEPQTPRSSATLTENLGLTAPSLPPGLSERNLACLKIFVSSALFLAGSLGDSWYQILEALQNADYVLTFKGLYASGSKRNLFSPTGAPIPASRSGSVSGSVAAQAANASNVQSQQAPKPPFLSDLDSETIQLAIQRLFDASKNLEDVAFKDFINALCKLSFEMVSMQSEFGQILSDGESVEDVGSAGGGGMVGMTLAAHRRRMSGIYVPRTLRSGDFGLGKLGRVALLNIHRLIYRSPDIAWYTTTTHLLSVIRLPSAPQAIRVQAAHVLDEILLIVPRNLTTTGELQAQVQRRVLDVLAQQVVPETSISATSSSTSMELRRMGLETLHQILQSSGHTLVVGWETVFHMLESVCRPAPPARSASSDSVSVLGSPPSPTSRLKPSLPGVGIPGTSAEKGYTALVKIASQSLTLVVDSVSSLPPEHLRLCISTLGQFGRQADTNIALTAAASLMWSVSDAIQAKRKDVEQEPQYSELWMLLLLEELGLCTDVRPEVRDGAIQTLFRTMQLYGSTLSGETWDLCVWKVTFPLLDALTAEIRVRAVASPAPPSQGDLPAPSPSVPVERAWDESKILALQSIGAIFHDFMVANLMVLESFPRAWDVFVNHVQESVLLDDRVISAPALRCLEKAIKASCGVGGEWTERMENMLSRVWEMVDTVGMAVLSLAEGGRTPFSSTGRRRVSSSSSEETQRPSYHPFTQESLVAFVDVIHCTRVVSRAVVGEEWGLEKLTRLMAILKGVLTYPNSPDYRPDVDALSPVQSVVLDAIANIDLSNTGVSSLVIRDIAEYTTLPFLAAFEVQGQNSKAAPGRITYIALCKKTMPLLVELYSKFKGNPDIYVDGTLEALLSAYLIPVKMKYDCPPASKYGSDLPLWKTATTCFLKVVKECPMRMRELGQVIPDERVEGIWKQILDVFKGGILADSSYIETLTLEEQMTEENFDLALIGALEIDVVPHIGDIRVPDHLVCQLGSILHQGSILLTTPTTDTSGTQHKASRSIEKTKIDKAYEVGTTELGLLVPRERFSYWCFDLLFLICSNMTQDYESSRRRLAALNLPSLLNRCRKPLVEYVADESLRGNIPFPRVREEELLYTLRKLLELRLWPGSLWAALSDSPTRYSVDQPSSSDSNGDIPITPSQLVADAVKRSCVAHLFHMYPVLCEIASKPRKVPAMPVIALERSDGSRDGVDGGGAGRQQVVLELDARMLARACLREIGKEMGLEY
ncbi:hypothetical protein AMATHDRAFT_151886 [Amanita thiersii Skay4041]|uniref:Protein MON2 homolog n=1 Tax=Amanita thiersii Skay4041 TaxID=703135 RepID=A0A2A9NA80_9AGAR|nr:hypothetical protein AMATHDRAFT_151886 [Amanita thiersii Skay4041]